MSEEHGKKHVDEISGVETTGHEWDGIRELNNPLPSWWLWTWVATIIWAVGYYVVMPSWPIPGKDGWTYAAGTLRYTEREAALNEVADAEAGRAQFRKAIAAKSFDEIRRDEQLMAVATASGRAIFIDNCAPCHGTGGQGSKGFPTLVDDDWLWGTGSMQDIQQTVTHGIRWNSDKDTRFSEMPNFIADGLLTQDQGRDVVNHVLMISGQKHDHASATRGAQIFTDNCAACHGPEGKGDPAQGAPNLTDAIWLYGGTADDITASINVSRKGVMPAWGGRLTPGQIKEVTLYLTSLSAQ